MMEPLRPSISEWSVVVGGLLVLALWGVLAGCAPLNAPKELEPTDLICYPATDAQRKEFNDPELKIVCELRVVVPAR